MESNFGLSLFFLLYNRIIDGLLFSIWTFSLNQTSFLCVPLRLASSFQCLLIQKLARQPVSIQLCSRENNHKHLISVLFGCSCSPGEQIPTPLWRGRYQAGMLGSSIPAHSFINQREFIKPWIRSWMISNLLNLWNDCPGWAGAFTHWVLSRRMKNQNCLLETIYKVFCFPCSSRLLFNWSELMQGF